MEVAHDNVRKAKLAASSKSWDRRAAERKWIGERLIFVEEGERVRFTEAGRRYAIELMAAGKSAEADAAGELDFDEARLLKLLLKRVIRATGKRLPDHWRKENIWRENNVWGAAGASGG